MTFKKEKKNMYTTGSTNQTYATDDYLFKIFNYAQAKHVTKKGGIY